MKNQNLYELFLTELQDMYSAEGQIVASLPRLIDASFHEEPKKALMHHLEETKDQIKRLERIFFVLDLQPKKKHCKGMEGILKEGEQITSNKTGSSSLDAAIIASAQKVEHYEIASYGTLCSFAKHLNLPAEIIELLKENLKEEETADKKLTKIADGSLFSTGINEEAVEDLVQKKEMERKNPALTR